MHALDKNLAFRATTAEEEFSQFECFSRLDASSECLEWKRAVPKRDAMLNQQFFYRSSMTSTPKDSRPVPAQAL
jgi:hypothetical protein